ncbi:Translation initiation factor eIF-2B subunit gamma [Nakaseomyces bracarensis]|uniref:Translation initiation factor eIF2B subunit gamma n=1 Tax=Nakaseomyces bracarensis TaxID=273131 RepID=A0ABR4NVF1_9SACH
MQIQAFIFCGRGHELSPFAKHASNNDSPMDASILGSDTVPKALLPLANKPMLEYIIDWCDQANFSEINIVAHQDQIDEIKSFLSTFLTLRTQQFDIISKALSANNHNHHLQKPKPIKFICSKVNSNGEALQKELLDKIKGDFVLLPCDFITDIPPQVLIDQFQNRDDDNLALTVYYKNNLETLDKKQQQRQQYFTVYSENEDTEKQPVLLDVYPKEEVMRNKYLQIRNQLLWKYPNATVSTTILNSSIYMCSYDLCKLLREQNDDETKSDDGDESDRTNSNSPKRSKGNDDDDSHAHRSLTEIKPSYFKKKNELRRDSINCHKPLGKLFRDLGRRSWQHSKSRETMGIFIIPEPCSFIRANNLNAYMEANRFILKIKAQATQSNVQTTTSSASAIGADSLVGGNVQILEKSNVKMSAIAGGCKIGNRCRVAGSILLGNVELEDDVILENVIIGPGAKIGKKSKLINCYIEGSYIVQSRSVHKGETLTKVLLNTDTEMDSEVAYSSSGEDSSDVMTEEFTDEDFGDDDFFER